MGLEKAKITDIAQTAQIAPGTFYLYFPSKLSIISAMAEKMITLVVNEIDTTVNHQAPFKTQLEQIIDAVYRNISKHRDIHALLYAGLAQGNSLRQWETLYQPFYQYISCFLEENRQNSVIRQSVCSEHVARLIIGLIESSAEQVYLYDSGGEKNAQERKRQLVDFLSHALLDKTD